MGTPSRPVILDESESCIVKGIELRHKTCTSYAYAMHIRRSSIGKYRPSGCSIRRLTGDTSGGTTLQQNETVAREYNIVSEVHVGSNVATPRYSASRLRQGRGIVLQGNAGALVGTKFRSTKGNVNHSVYVNEGRGWHVNADGHYVPTEVLVYDPEANGRLTAWGRAAKGPGWWPWSLVKKFAAALRPWGDTDSRTLGSDKWYCAIGPDTEPHVHLKFGAHKTSPFPDAMRAHPVDGQDHVAMRAGPGNRYKIVGTLDGGRTFSAYQVTDAGAAVTWTDSAGVKHTSSRWYGTHNGTSWLHTSRVRT